MKKLTAFLFMIILTILFSVPTLAAPGTGKSYTYDHNDKAMAIPDPYEVERVLHCADLGLSKPAAIICKDGAVYVLGGEDSSCVAVLNEDFSLNRTIRISQNGMDYKTVEPRGIWVGGDGSLFIADRGKKLVFQTDARGEVIREYAKPQSEVYGDGDFLPLQVLTDRIGRVYVLSEGEYRGIIRLSSEGKFLDFYGAKKVEITASVLLDTLWSRFMTDAQQEGSMRHLPVEYAGITADSEGFIYTVSGSGSAAQDTLTKLNSGGKNILDAGRHFGDYNLGNFMGTWYKTGFTSICVDSQGFITALDKTWNRLFQYSQEGELLYVFGGKEAQAGTFGEVGTVASLGDRLLVLDSAYHTITVFKPTSFGLAVREGSELFESGLFTQSIEPWRAALRQCGNYEPAYVGIGKALHADKQYEEAMSYFKMGYSQENYSLSYARHRAAAMRSAFAPFMTLLLVAAVLILVCVKWYRAKSGRKALVLDSSGKLPYLFHCVVHPADGFQEMRYNHKGSLAIANILVFLWFLMTACDFQYRGFIFNSNLTQNFNVFSTLAVTIGAAFVFCLTNWLLSTFFEGKGHLKAVWIHFCYSLLPLIVTMGISLLLSHLLTLDERMFMNYLSVIGTGWTLLLIAVSLGQLHQYSLRKNAASLVCSVIGVAVVVFLLFLFVNLFMQFGEFLKSVVSEILYRTEVHF